MKSGTSCLFTILLGKFWGLHGSAHWFTIDHHPLVEDMCPRGVPSGVIADCHHSIFRLTCRRRHSLILRVASIQRRILKPWGLIMGAFSILHWLIVVLILCIPAWLFARISSKAGFSGWWAIFGVIPVVNLVALWVFAFCDWPKLPQRK